MHHLHLQRITATREDGEPYAAVELRIDGQSLMDLLRHFEAPLAQAEGHPSLAAAYGWPACDAALRAALEGHSGDDGDGTVTLLDCNCGAPGCWPLHMTVRITDTEVRWSGFAQQHRGPDAAAGHWRYDGFGPFIFSRAAYAAALDSIT